MNKTIMFSVLLILALSLSGCGVQQQVQKNLKERQPETVQVDEIEPEPVVIAEPEVVTEPEVTEAEPEPEPTPPKPEPAADEYNLESLPKEVQSKVKLVRKLMDEARNSEENYFFRYTSPDILQTDVWVKGNHMKRTILRYDQVDKYNTYNMVYLNRDSLIAEGYCETTKAKCFEGHGPFTETYSKWNIKTPKDWLLELDDDFVWSLDNKISNQLYHIVDYHKDGKIIRVYVNDYKGWPGRVEIYEDEGQSLDSLPTGKPDKTYIYDDMDIGGVTDDDVIKSS